MSDEHQNRDDFGCCSRFFLLQDLSTRKGDKVARLCLVFYMAVVGQQVEHNSSRARTKGMFFTKKNAKDGFGSASCKSNCLFYC